MLTNEQARATLMAGGWILTDEDSFGSRDKEKSSEDWVFHGDGQSSSTIVVLRSWSGHFANGDPVKIAEFIALAGIKVPGFVVVPEEVLTRGMSALKSITSSRYTSFGLAMFQDELAALIPPKEGT